MSDEAKGLVGVYMFPITKKPIDLGIASNSSVTVYYYYGTNFCSSAVHAEHMWFSNKYSEADKIDIDSGRFVILGWVPNTDSIASRMLGEANTKKAKEQALINRLGLMAQANVPTVITDKRKIRVTEQ